MLAAAAAVAAVGPYQSERPLPEPALFGEGIVSTGEFESHPAFTPDGRTLYFVRSTPAFTDWKIYVSRYAGGAWSKPEMAPFSGRYRDADPFVTADGRQLFFISDRPVDGTPAAEGQKAADGGAKEDMDVWVMEREAGGRWGKPRNLGAPVNSPGNEWLPRPAADGTLYFGSDRPGGLGKTDLYRARREGGGYAEPQNLGPAINSEADEYEGCIAPDQSFLVFMAAGRPDDRGGGDLYISERNEDGWTQARPLGESFNGRGLEIAPYLSPDGKYFFFSSARRMAGAASGSKDAVPGRRPDRARNGLGDIYQVDVGALKAGAAP